MSYQPEHKSHVLKLSIYCNVAIALLILTGITVWASFQDFGSFNLVVAMIIAVIKAGLVMLFFMHLKYDNRIYAIVFGSAILFLAIFIVFTMFDTLNRGTINAQTAGVISERASIYDANGRVIVPRKEGELSAFELENGIGPMTEEVQVGPIDEAMAHRGQLMFEMKCASCHKLDERLVGPPLRDVTKRRTPTYIMNMILNPNEMVKIHPEAKKLLPIYMTFMTFQNVTPDDARLLLEYLRQVGTQPAQATQ